MKMLGNKIRTMDTRSVRPRPKKVDQDLRDPMHLIWRAQVLTRAGYRCEAVNEDGKRCSVAAPDTLFADHIMERFDGGALFDPDNGQCLCGSHHSKKTIAARAARMSERF